MRFLADAGLSPKTVAFLNELGHEATHVRDLGLQRAPDFELVERARMDGSVIVTFDLDFGDTWLLAFSRGRAPSSFDSGMNAQLRSTSVSPRF